VGGGEIKRSGFHGFRQSLCSFFMAQVENPNYEHCRKTEKLDAQADPVLEAVLRGETGAATGSEAIR